MGSFTKLTYHVIFGTKYRRKSISSDIEPRLYQYIGGTVRGQKGHLIEIGGIEDHIHLLTYLSPARSVSEAVRDLKANSSRWMNELSQGTSQFEWQKGYSAFTVSYSQIDTVQFYIRNQREHHRAKSFEQEYVSFLRRHDIVFDSRNLFEQEHHG